MDALSLSVYEDALRACKESTCAISRVACQRAKCMLLRANYKRSGPETKNRTQCLGCLDKLRADDDIGNVSRVFGLAHVPQGR